MNWTRTLLVSLALLVFALSPALAQDNGTHTVQSGENLFRIALRYGISMDEIITANGLADPTRIFAGQVLIIPGLSPVDESDEVANPLVASAPILHTVQRGEILSRIAQTYGVPVEQILRANNIADPNTIYAGQQLQIWTEELGEATTTDPTLAGTTTETAAPVEAAAENPAIADGDAATVETAAEAQAAPEAAEAAAVVHVVQSGEHLAQIAQRYGVRWTTIAEANGLINPNTIYAGMELTIPDGDPGAVPVTQETRQAYITNVEKPGAHLGVGRELVVDLSTQMAYAYEDGVLQKASLVSTGLPATPTVQGNYAIWHKTQSQTMSGPGYYLPGVKWVMYFYQGYGFHGTYWHNNFGQPMSHGCVNMTDEDAEWFYNFASIGTPVHVQW